MVKESTILKSRTLKDFIIKTHKPRKDSDFTKGSDKQTSCFSFLKSKRQQTQAVQNHSHSATPSHSKYFLSIPTHSSGDIRTIKTPENPEKIACLFNSTPKTAKEQNNKFFSNCEEYGVVTVIQKQN
ncbi:hypothetical protein PHYBLDRAFT_174841 [Phycomyces blakesleeanus NRRL 1555(-)]|uniref:Uncharacterized protein n=1 Tax=Phycomyces blakesleeanus (strain ATCC 8743b / DSM 1359 / FGSC 10004 / NBRC 33097 / NRRL 1555) TaxID=763407 RepID=A0A167JWJ6_PHYB8|nr:hypothetical protein PHYBLDRAFT_174841 [Phycomyces blakesleeanus NRRL 1555(-)]OAD66817.1 hypothetical protein PHYBLDRAFT_174841 [Phycomyces blakesleeanus NRRL 1555(-)]|eukprot:XP_018284857.1 hypothetical protein PHYBLDRAFT_174841 [Phycomyces blakesleeanus NRRL 1555(-)]